MHPYREQLSSLVGSSVELLISGVRDPIRGTVESVKECGCFLTKPSVTAGSIERTFVAHKDIRGITTDEWDLSDPH